MKQKQTKQKQTKNSEFMLVIYLFLALFLGMMAYFVYFQAIKSEDFINNPYNSLQNLFSERVIRGDIVSADGEVLAITRTDELGAQTREYPYGRMFAHAVGYAVNGRAGIEYQENFALLRSHEFFIHQIVNDLTGGKSRGDVVVTTLDTGIQQTAYDALGNYDGAVIVMEPKTGKILAMVSKPDFDPNTVSEDWTRITADGSTVLYNRATQGKYTPGSVFKLFTTLEYYREHPEDYGDYSFDCSGAFTLEGQTIHCASNKRHGTEDLKSSFANSCNASYANLALRLDADRFAQTCSGLLFDTNLPIAFESGKSSFRLTGEDSAALKMETAIGQGLTLVSPLHMALVVSAIDNGGVLMTPYLVDHIQNASGTLVDANEPRENQRLLSAEEARFLREFLGAVVTDGTAHALNNMSYQAYGKTGTAQVSDSSGQTNAWFVGFATRAGYEDIAVAVVVENSGGGSTYAVPVAKSVFDLYFAR